jgi:DNA-binding response OmpR family regulator
MADEFKGKRILLVDDDSEVLKSLEATLADTGATIETAGDGNTAIEKAHANMPDLMVLDLMMPKRSGFLVLENIKKGKKKKEAPRIIIITGNTGLRHRVYAESLGAEYYLTKPFRLDRLMEAVTDLLS